MATDVLILNTAVLDLRGPAFDFVTGLVGPGGLARCPVEDMPPYSQEQIRQWVREGCATAGGPGNTAPLVARAGLNVAVACNLGRGDEDGLDVQGRTFHDILSASGVDVSACRVHPGLPTGTTFIHDAGEGERGGIGYFANANEDFDLEAYKGAVERLNPTVVYYMYSGLSRRGDANGGRDLAAFMAWCRERGAITIADSHTLAGDPQKLIAEGTPVEAYRLLEPLLPELDLFFTSADEAKMIENTLAGPREWDAFSDEDNIRHFLTFLAGRFWDGAPRPRLFGVTVSNGAWEIHGDAAGKASAPCKVTSRFLAGEVIDLVGAGDSFRAGLVSYVSQNTDAFRRGALDAAEAIQMGNLFASLYIKAPLQDRYGNVRPYARLLQAVRSDRAYGSFEDIMRALEAAS